jgi:hypothetical protein
MKPISQNEERTRPRGEVTNRISIVGEKTSNGRGKENGSSCFLQQIDCYAI